MDDDVQRLADGQFARPADDEFLGIGVEILVDEGEGAAFRSAPPSPRK